MSSNEPPIRQFYGVEYIDFATHLRNVDDLTTALIEAMQVAGADILPATRGSSWYDMISKFSPEKLNVLDEVETVKAATIFDPLEYPKPTEVQVLKIGDNQLEVDHWPEWFRSAYSGEKIRWIPSMPVDAGEHYIEVLTIGGWMLCKEGNFIVINALGWMTVRETADVVKPDVNLREVKVISVGNTMSDIKTDHSPAWFEQCINTGRVTVYFPTPKAPHYKCLSVKGQDEFFVCKIGQIIEIDDAGILTVKDDI